MPVFYFLEKKWSDGVILSAEGAKDLLLKDLLFLP